MPSRAALRAAIRLFHPGKPKDWTPPDAGALMLANARAAIFDEEFADVRLALEDLVAACTPPRMPTEKFITGVRVPERDVVAQARAALAKVRPKSPPPSRPRVRPGAARRRYDPADDFAEPSEPIRYSRCRWCNDSLVFGVCPRPECAGKDVDAKYRQWDH